jgi:general secretion pathway protein K
VLTLLSVIAAQFCHAMRTEVNITRNFKDSTQAYYIARAGLSLTIKALIRNQLYDVGAEEEGEAEAPAESAGGETQWRVNAENPEVDFGDGRFTVWIENDSGKVDLNSADRNMLAMTLNGFDLDEADKEAIVDSILDWRDADDLHRLSGAESDYYQSLPKPYACKNADFDTIEELLLVKGVTPEIFNDGLDGIVTVRDSGGGGGGGERLPILRRGARTGEGVQAPLVRSARGRSQININAAPRNVLLALPQMTEALAAAIEEYRREKDFISITEVQEVVGPEVFAAIAPYIGLDESPFYTVHARGAVSGSAAQRTVRARLEINPRYDSRYRILGWIDG